MECYIEIHGAVALAWEKGLKIWASSIKILVSVSIRKPAPWASRGKRCDGGQKI